jgi:SAM-dependent methyltransferase
VSEASPILQPGERAIGSVGQSLAAALDTSYVDRLNAAFYSRIEYPWPPHSLERFHGGLWVLMLNQDVGAWRAPRIPSAPEIWVAGCGTNQAVITALRFPRASVLGSDLSEASLEVARRSSEALGVSNLELVRESINEADYAERFDYVICTGVIHHNADPASSLRRLASATKRQGLLELMVYNQFHRIQTAAFQQALRAMLRTSTSPDFETEKALAQRLVECREGRGSMRTFLEARVSVPKAAFADALLQPVERSFTVESLAALAGCCGLEVLHPAIDAYSRSRGAVDWNLCFADAEVRRLYETLPDVERWHVTNLMRLEESPALWFYLQRTDSGLPRQSEASMAAAFLDERLVRVTDERELLVREPGGGYRSRGRQPVPAGAPPDREAAAVLADLPEGGTVGEVVSRLGLERSPRRVNRLRLGLATSAFPYLCSRALIEAES